MAQISSHFNLRPYQVAISNDKNLEYRKWNHIGTIYAVTHRDAAYKTAFDKNIKGDIISVCYTKYSTVFNFSENIFVSVGFGS